MLCIKTLSSSQLLLQFWSIKLMVATNCNNGFSKSYNNLSFSNKGMHPCSLVKHNTNQWSFLILKCTTGASIASICYFIDWILYMTVLGLDIVEHPIWLNIKVWICGWVSRFIVRWPRSFVYYNKVPSAFWSSQQKDTSPYNNNKAQPRCCHMYPCFFGHETDQQAQGFRLCYVNLHK